MKGYDQCQKMKNRAKISIEKLRSKIVPEKLWQYISVDFITKLPVSRNYDLIWIVYI